METSNLKNKFRKYKEKQQDSIRMFNSNMTPNDFLKLILEQSNVTFTPPPKGWYLTKDLAKQWKCSTATVQNYINRGIRLGIVDKNKFHVKIDGVGIRLLPHYFFKSKKNACISKNKH